MSFICWLVRSLSHFYLPRAGPRATFKTYSVVRVSYLFHVLYSPQQFEVRNPQSAVPSPILPRRVVRQVGRILSPAVLRNDYVITLDETWPLARRQNKES